MRRKCPTAASPSDNVPRHITPRLVVEKMQQLLEADPVLRGGTVRGEKAEHALMDSSGIRVKAK